MSDAATVIFIVLLGVIAIAAVAIATIQLQRRDNELRAVRNQERAIMIQQDIHDQAAKHHNDWMIFHSKRLAREYQEETIEPSA